MEWFVVLHGNEDDLAKLAHLLNTPELRITHLQDVDITPYLASQETFNIPRQPAMA